MLLLLMLAAATTGWWYYHRPRPESVRRTLFTGVEYTRDVRCKPRPVIIHVVKVALGAPGIGFLVTPGDPRKLRPLQARTTSQFLREFGLQVAINGDFFFPWHSTAPWDYYPHVGDPVELEGFAASRGTVYSDHPVKNEFPTLYLSRDNRVRFEKPNGPVYNAISGLLMLLRDGKPVPLPANIYDTPEPRTAVGVDRERKHLILVVVDGRQPNYSEGVSMEELAEISRTYGASDALNLDGGGSSTLVIEGPDRKPEELNCPIDNHIPGRERPVANHLGVFALPLDPSPRLRPSSTALR